MIDVINRGARVLPTWVVYLLGALPLAWLVWAVLTGALGPDPVKGVEHRLGLWGLQFLIATLAISPLRRIGLNLVRHRRALGLIAFFHVALHLVAWAVLDMGLLWNQIVSDLWKRPYILVGFAGFLGMVPLALTSTNAAIRRMGPKAWMRLHQLTYAVGIAGAVHYLLLVKVISVEPLLYAGLVGAVLAIRLLPKKGRLQSA